MTEYDVHPVAARFPMLPDDELQELADDIRERGLLHPVVLDSEGRILDGRNRLAACRIAGVDPVFDEYPGTDTDGYAWSVNVRRRSMTKAQTAIIAVDTFTGKDFPTRKIAELAGVSHMMVVWAQAVTRYPNLRAAVLSGASLKENYDVAREFDAEEAARQAKKDRLRSDAPDLLAFVDDERMDLDEAIGALDTREAKAAAEAEAARNAADRERQQKANEKRQQLERDRERLRMVATGWSTMRDIILPDPTGKRSQEILKDMAASDREAIMTIVRERDPQ